MSTERPLRVTAVSMARAVWGSERSLLSTAGELHQHGVELSIAAPEGSAFARSTRAAGVRFLPLELPAHTGAIARHDPNCSVVRNLVGELPRVRRGSLAVSRVTANADVVHVNSLLAYPDCVMSGRRHRRPTVLEMHDLVRPGISRSLLAASVWAADAAIAISSPVAASVPGWAAASVELIPPAVDIARFSPGPRDPGVRAELTAYPDDLLVAVIGRIDPGKGVPTVVGAVEELNRAGVAATLVVVGSGTSGNEDYAGLTKMDAHVRLADRVRFVGDREDIVALLRSVDVLVNASDDEPFGLSVLEAQAVGVPVVTSDRGGLTDFVVDGRTGRTFAPTDIEALAKALREHVDTPWAVAERSAAAQDQVTRKYSSGARAEALSALYRRVGGRS